MKALTCSVLLFLLVMAQIAQSSDTLDMEWNLVNATYMEVLCDNDPFSYSWTNPVLDLDGNAKFDLGGTIDKWVRYDGDPLPGDMPPYFSILAWTRPYYDPWSKEVKMTLGAQDLKRPISTLRICVNVFGIDNRGDKHQYGGGWCVFTQNKFSPYVAGPVATFRSPIVIDIIKYYNEQWNSFYVTIGVTDGGRIGCYDVAKYYFERVKNEGPPVLAPSLEAQALNHQPQPNPVDSKYQVSPGPTVIAPILNVTDCANVGSVFAYIYVPSIHAGFNVPASNGGCEHQKLTVQIGTADFTGYSKEIYWIYYGYSDKNGKIFYNAFQLEVE